MTGRLSTKLSIHHIIEQDVTLVGILEQLAPHEPTQDRKLALVRLQSLYLTQFKVIQPYPIASAWVDGVSTVCGLPN